MALSSHLSSHLYPCHQKDIKINSASLVKQERSPACRVSWCHVLCTPRCSCSWERDDHCNSFFFSSTNKNLSILPGQPSSRTRHTNHKKSPAIKCLITPTFMSIYLQFYVSIYYDVDIKLCFCTEYNLILIQTRSFDVYFN